MSALRPIEIIGGGLAGLSLGRALRQEQVPVTLYEAGDYPRHRVCGEFITGLHESTVQRLRLTEILHNALIHREVAWFIGQRHPHHQKLVSPAYGLSRHRLDARLAEDFIASGGVLHTKSRHPETPPLAGTVLATGRRRGRSPWIGLKIHATGLTTTRELELHLGKKCYVGLSRIENQQVNVCGLFHRQTTTTRGPDLIFEYLRSAGLKKLAHRLSHVALDETSFSAVAGLDFDPHVHGTAHLRVGDHMAMIPPFTGNGMAMAFQSAECALDPLLDYAKHNSAWSDTCALVQKKLHQRFHRRLATANFLHPFLLTPRRQQWLSILSRNRLLPMRLFDRLLH